MIKNNFNTIYKDIYPKLKAFLSNGWNISEEDIEEIIHDVLFILHNKTLSSVFKWNKSWLYKTTYNKAIDKIRHKKYTNNDIYFDEEIISCYPTPEEQLLKDYQRAWIKNFLAKLDKTNQRIAYLYYFEDLTCKKIGTILQIPTGTIKFRLYNIRKKLEEDYSNNEKK